MSKPKRVLNYLSACAVLSVSICSYCLANIYQPIPSTQPIAAATANDYVDAIEDIEAEQGTYSVELSDLYLSLGRAQLVQGDFLNAKRAFERGMQIERINNGLNSISQRPFLLSLADTESYLGNWRQSRNALDNLYSINWRTYGDNDPKLLPVLDEILDWFLQTYERRTPSGGYENLIVAERVGQTIDAILSSNSDIDSQEKASKHRKLASLHYVISNHIRQHGDKNSSEVTFTSGQSSLNGRNLTSSHLHFQRGKRALEKVVESLVEEDAGTPQEQALAIAQLGDWYLIFGQRYAAQRTYVLASDLLTNLDPSEDSSLVLFEKPYRIRFDLGESFNKGLEKTATHQDDDKGTIEVGMTVSRLGAISNIEVINSSKEITDKQVANLKANLRNTRFRPKIVNGETAVSSHREFFPATMLER